jgi:peptidyl-prolyl cis-trans isomerase A (cyclophilin A)
MKMKSKIHKFKILCLFFLGITLSFAQTSKKPVKKASKPLASKTVVKKAPAATPAQNPNEGIFAEFETSKGKIVVQLEYKKTPVTVANFITLAEGTNTYITDDKLKGKPFYNGLKFHRVIKDFMIQGGDPQGNGSGGPGYAFKDEFTDAAFDKAGILAMANSGPKTNGSQFFITHKETPWLNGKHTIFGYVKSGQDVVNAIAQDDLMNKVTIIRKGAEAKKFDAIATFAIYCSNKVEDDKKQAAIDVENNSKQAAIDAENRAKQAVIDAEKKAEYVKNYATVMAAKVASLNAIRATSTKTASGLEYKITQKGSGKKPVDGSTIYIHYAGYLEDGTLFDSSYEDVSKACGKFDGNKAAQNGYQPFPFQAGKKDGLIPGFLEGVSLLSFGDKATIFIPSKLGYGAQGAGNVIPPNSNIIFELEIFENAPVKQ